MPGIYLFFSAGGGSAYGGSNSFGEEPQIMLRSQMLLQNRIFKPPLAFGLTKISIPPEIACFGTRLLSPSGNGRKTLDPDF
jgi:hypothetical protein